MEKRSNIKLQLAMSLCMFIISVFMSISYYIKISNNEADKLTMIAFLRLFMTLGFLKNKELDMKRIKETPHNIMQCFIVK